MSENPLEVQSEKQQETATASKSGEALEVATSREVLEADELPSEELVRVVTRVIASEFSGPLPPPDVIRDYEGVMPGFADRIMALTERQAVHRQEMERIIISAESRDSLLGVLFAFILGAGSLLSGIIMVVTVPQSAGAIAGSLLGASGIGAIVITFIKSTRRNQEKGEKGTREEENKAS